VLGDTYLRVRALLLTNKQTKTKKKHIPNFNKQTNKQKTKKQKHIPTFNKQRNKQKQRIKHTFQLLTNKQTNKNTFQFLTNKQTNKQKTKKQKNTFHAKEILFISYYSVSFAYSSLVPILSNRNPIHTRPRSLENTHH
jgi:hypothetical protein